MKNNPLIKLRIMSLSEFKHLSCPVIRTANSQDAEQIANIIINSDTALINSIFGKKKNKAKNALYNQYSKFYEGLLVLCEGNTVVGVMKLHLPDEPIGKTISLKSLVQNLGLFSGIRASILLSYWDEYKLSQGETYLEFLYIKSEYHGFGCEKLLLDKAIELSKNGNSTYLTMFSWLNDYKLRGVLESEGFIARRKNYFVFARVLRSMSHFQKYTYTLIDGPITIRETLSFKIEQVKDSWKTKREEVYAATRLSITLMVVPVVAGFFAFFRGFYIASLWWILIITFHIFGTIRIRKGSNLGRYGLSIALILEGSNLLLRTFKTFNWFDRLWLLPLAMLSFWISFVLLSTNSHNLFVKDKHEETKTIRSSSL